MEKYKKEGVVGQGTYGVVYKATELHNNKQVAIKKVRLGKMKDGVSFTALREIKVLQELKHLNVIELLDVYAHNSNIHLVFDFMEWDLEAVIKDRKVLLSDGDIKCYMLQLLRGVEHCHKNWILHRDLKPNNLLLGPQGILKIADFGLARAFGSPNNIFTHQVVTRWYRAPELLFGAKSYSYGVDMWSVGCVFAELMLRTPYFPGDTDIDQLSKIFTALGTPSEEIWPGVTSLPDYVPYNFCAPTPFRQLFTAAGDDALDLLGKLLRYNPSERISASEALQHPYFSNNPTPTSPSLLPRIDPTNKTTTNQDAEIEAILKSSPGYSKKMLEADHERDGLPLKRKLNMDVY